MLYFLMEAKGKQHRCQSRSLESPGFSRGGMRCNLREVALSSTLRDNSTYKLQRTLFLKFGSHYCTEPPAPTGGGSTH
jgi:hypothetical protein